MPFLPHSDDDYQPGVLVAAYESDPRPLHIDQDHGGDFTHDIQPFRLAKRLYAWSQVIKEVGVQADLENKARCMVAAQTVGPEVNQYTPEGFVDILRCTDAEHRHHLTWSRPEVHEPIMREVDRDLSSDTGLHEVAGAWIFKPYVCGEMAMDEEGHLMYLPGPAWETHFTVSLHNPGLMVFEQQPQSVYDREISTRGLPR